MKKETLYLDLYNRCIELGELPIEGLCYSLLNAGISNFGTINLFRPELSDEISEEYKPKSYKFWGNNKEYVDWIDSQENISIKKEFNQFRQDILIWCMVINEEI